MRIFLKGVRAMWHVWTGKAVIVNAVITKKGIIRINGIHWVDSEWKIPNG